MWKAMAGASKEPLRVSTVKRTTINMKMFEPVSAERPEKPSLALKHLIPESPNKVNPFAIAAKNIANNRKKANHTRS